MTNRADEEWLEQISQIKAIQLICVNLVLRSSFDIKREEYRNDDRKNVF
jgi:hypothetical protein